MIVLLLLTMVPAVASAQDINTDINSILFKGDRYITINPGNVCCMSFTPQYTADYTFKTYDSRYNMYVGLSQGDDVLIPFGAPIPNEQPRANQTHTNRLIAGKEYTYYIKAQFEDIRTLNVKYSISSGVSGQLDENDPMSASLVKTHFDSYAPQQIFDNLIVYANANKDYWLYDHSIKNEADRWDFNGVDVIVDLSGCGSVGKNTMTVYYQGYKDTLEFYINEAPTEPPTEAPTEPPTEAPTEVPTQAPITAVPTTPATVPTAAPPVVQPVTIKSVKLSTSAYTYNGKAKKPSVKVVDSNGSTVSSSNYTVTYAKGRKNIGKYSVKVKFKGKFSGSKTLYFKINPKSTSLSSVKAGKKKLTVKWKKQTTQTTGYQVQYSTSKKFTGAKTTTVSKNKTTSKTISKLKGKKKYYVRIRTYKTVGKTKYYSSWSKAKSVTTKK